MVTSWILAIALAATPLLVVVGLLCLADRRQERRDQRYARQIELTDAIHRELGAVAAPTLERGRAGVWLVHLALPLERPALVGDVLGIVDQTFLRFDARRRVPFRVVISPVSPSTPAHLRLSKATGQRAVGSSGRPVPALR
ncbi:MAG TPA: hypothetical protein VEL75_02815 [Candidatus Methylomirabilis sp.]|nr:hypothetical protein [Candidatus Methylomirabilis sp.]